MFFWYVVRGPVIMNLTFGVTKCLRDEHDEIYPTQCVFSIFLDLVS